MTTGAFSDSNLAAESGAVVSVPTGLGWSATLPVTNLVVQQRYISSPARCTTPLTLANSKFDLTLANARAVGLIGLMFHTLGLDALFRVSLAAAGDTLAAPTYLSAWLPVFDRLYASSALPWEALNWWTGQASGDDLELQPQHRWFAPPEEVIAEALRVEINDVGNTAGYFDIGGLWVSTPFTVTFNYDRGRELGAAMRDQQDEAPSGRVFSEERQPRRTLNLTWSMLTDLEAYRFFDVTMRVRSTRPVVFIPDIDDPVSVAREAWPALLTKAPAPRFTYSGLDAATATLKEIIA